MNELFFTGLSTFFGWLFAALAGLLVVAEFRGMIRGKRVAARVKFIHESEERDSDGHKIRVRIPEVEFVGLNQELVSKKLIETNFPHAREGDIMYIYYRIRERDKSYHIYRPFATVKMGLLVFLILCAWFLIGFASA